jgi:hypothetical protein
VQWDQLSPTVQPLLEPFVDPQRLLVKRENGTVEVGRCPALGLAARAVG